MSNMNWNRPNGGYERQGGLSSSGGFKTGARNKAIELRPKPVEIKVSPCLDHTAEVKFVENKPHLWCIDCKKSIMPMTTIEYTNYLMIKKSTSKQDPIVNFGKFKGHSLYEIPTSYIKWVIINVADKMINCQFNAELARRK